MFAGLTRKAGAATSFWLRRPSFISFSQHRSKQKNPSDPRCDEQRSEQDLQDCKAAGQSRAIGHHLKWPKIPAKLAATLLIDVQLRRVQHQRREQSKKDEPLHPSQRDIVMFLPRILEALVSQLP